MSKTSPSCRAGVARLPIPGLMIAALLMVASAAPASASDTAPTLADSTAIAPTPAAAKVPAAATAAEPAPADLGQALRAAVDEARGRMRPLQAAMKAAPDPQQAAALRAEVDAIHREMRRRLLDVQLEYAQRSGDAALVDELTGILQRLDQPAFGVPQNRPAPPAAPSQTPQPAPVAR